MQSTTSDISPGNRVSVISIRIQEMNMTALLRGIALVPAVVTAGLLSAGCNSAATSTEKMEMRGENMATEKMGMQKTETEMMGKKEMGK